MYNVVEKVPAAELVKSALLGTLVVIVYLSLDAVVGTAL